MEKFEYDQLYMSYSDDGTNHLDKLNSFGDKGWELVTALKIDEHNICYIFKRRKEKTLLMEVKTEERN